MGESLLPLQLNKRPLPEGLDPTDAALCRKWVVDMVANTFVRMGTVQPTVFILHAEFFVIADLHDMFDIGEESHAAATVRALAAMEGAVRAFRVGEVLVGEAGSMRRAVGALECGPGDAWWLAWGHVGQGEAGVGVLHGDWTVAEGTGEIPEPFDEWLAAGDARVNLQVPDWKTAKPPEDADVRACIAHFKQDPPESLEDLARALEMHMRPQVERDGMSHLVVLCQRGRKIEQWEIRGDLPGTLDDVVRNIAQYSNPESIAVVQVGIMLVDGEPKRAVLTHVERDGRRVERAMPVRDKPGGGHHLPQSFGPRELGPIREAEGWLGVPPKDLDMGIYLLGNEGRPIDEF